MASPDANNFGGCSWDDGDCCGEKRNIKYCKGTSVDNCLNLTNGVGLLDFLISPAWVEKHGLPFFLFHSLIQSASARIAPRQNPRSVPARRKAASCPNTRRTRTATTRTLVWTCGSAAMITICSYSIHSNCTFTILQKSSPEKLGMFLARLPVTYVHVGL